MSKSKVNWQSIVKKVFQLVWKAFLLCLYVITKLAGEILTSTSEIAKKGLK